MTFILDRSVEVHKYNYAFSMAKKLLNISKRSFFKKLCYKSALSPCSLVDNELRRPLVLTVHILRLLKVRCCSLDTCLKVS